MTVKEQMLHAFAEAHEKLLTSATNAVTRGAASSKNWGPREILAHIAAWEAEALHRIPLVAAGASDKAYDVDAFNAIAVATIGDKSFQQVERTLRQTHQRLIRLLERREERAFSLRGYAHEWVAALTRHSEEHVHELDQLGY